MYKSDECEGHRISLKIWGKKGRYTGDIAVSDITDHIIEMDYLHYNVKKTFCKKKLYSTALFRRLILSYFVKFIF
jgi:hypothetical protein